MNQDVLHGQTFLTRDTHWWRQEELEIAVMQEELEIAVMQEELEIAVMQEETSYWEQLLCIFKCISTDI